MLRAITELEEKTASLLVVAGESAAWEYSASLVCPEGPLLEFSTEMLDYQANPSSTLLYLIDNLPENVLHHNHLSGESLSSGDWRGASVYFNEIFAHCNDGTIYYGKVLNKEMDLPSLFRKIETKAQDCLFKYTQSPDIDDFFRKEIINRAFKIKGYVEYEYSWGGKNTSHQKITALNLSKINSIGQLGAAYNGLIDNAATDLSKMQW
jgi:hypothetical protein